MENCADFAERSEACFVKDARPKIIVEEVA